MTQGVAQVIESLMRDGLPVRLTAYDGSKAGPPDAEIELCSRYENPGELSSKFDWVIFSTDTSNSLGCACSPSGGTVRKKKRSPTGCVVRASTWNSGTSG